MGFKKVASLLTYEGDVVALRLETDKNRFVDLETDYVKDSDEWNTIISSINAEKLALKPFKDKLVTDIEIALKKSFQNITSNCLLADKAVEFITEKYSDLTKVKDVKEFPNGFQKLLTDKVLKSNSIILIKTNSALLSDPLLTGTIQNLVSEVSTKDNPQFGSLEEKPDLKLGVSNFPFLEPSDYFEEDLDLLDSKSINRLNRLTCLEVDGMKLSRDLVSKVLKLRDKLTIPLVITEGDSPLGINDAFITIVNKDFGDYTGLTGEVFTVTLGQFVPEFM